MPLATPSFNEKKATQAAARLLSGAAHSLPCIKLLHLMYLTDREAVIRWSEPVTDDRYCLRSRGPILERTHALMVDEPFPGEPAYWSRFISSPLVYAVRLADTADVDALSEIEVHLLDEMVGKYGQTDRFSLAQLVRDLPECQNRPEGGGWIEIGDILTATGKKPEEIAEILHDVADAANLRAVSAEAGEAPAVQLGAGDTFLTPAGGNWPPRLWIVLTPPNADNESVVVRVTTADSETTTVCQVGEHPNVTQRSVVSHRSARLLNLSGIGRGVEGRAAIRLQPGEACHPWFLQKVRAGIVYSNFTPKYVKAYCRQFFGVLGA